LQNRVQQDKRPRHVCAAKILSAHQFWKHASSPLLCRCSDKPLNRLAYSRAYYARLRSIEKDVAHVEAQ
jgi:hypothetical protein